MKRILELIIVAVMALLPLGSGFSSEPRTEEELFFRSNQAYKEGNFSKAIEGYRELIRSGMKSGHLYYNLGNACFRLNNLGKAILYYERAHLFIPRDADLNFNLGYARDQTQDALPQSRSFIGLTFFWLDSLSRSELVLCFAVVNLIIWLVLLARLFHRPEWTYYLIFFLLILWLLAGSSLGLKWYQEATDNRAVIIEEEINVLAGPDSNDTVLFQLHEGTIVCHERSEDGWSLIRLPDEKRGWVRAGTVERIIRE